MYKYHEFVPFFYLSLWSAYKGNAKIWWKFAIQSILETEVKRRKNNWSWDHMLNHRNLCRSYSDSYRSKLVSKKVSNDLQKTCDFHEESLDLFNLLLIRQRVELEVRFHHIVILSEENQKTYLFFITKGGTIGKAPETGTREKLLVWWLVGQ